MGVGRESEFRDFVHARGASLLRSAHVLTQDHGYAEDLVQNALVRVYVSWDRVSKADDPFAYAQRILFNSFSRMRRKRVIAEELGVAAEGSDPGSVSHAADDRDQLSRALEELPANLRAVLVLRFYEDLSVEQSAQILGCSIGTVKSRTARALARLRLSPQLDAREGQGS